jgi:uncharacterized protein YndB with AHSA1/START domain
MTTESTIDGDERVLRLTRHFEAPREIIFRAWTDPAWLVRWMGPQQCTCPHAEADLRVGGALKIAIRNSEGKDHTAHGIYQAIEAPATLSFTWRWEQEDGTLGPEMLIHLEFLDRDEGTELVFTQTRFPTDESRDQHEGGWTGSFESLADALETLILES